MLHFPSPKGPGEACGSHFNECENLAKSSLQHTEVAVNWGTKILKCYPLGLLASARNRMPL